MTVQMISEINLLAESICRELYLKMKAGMKLKNLTPRLINSLCETSVKWLSFVKPLKTEISCTGVKEKFICPVYHSERKVITPQGNGSGEPTRIIRMTIFVLPLNHLVHE